MSVNNEQFYSRLPANHIPLSDLLVEEHLFYSVPSDWHVIVTDIKNSTLAVSSGLHETVNLVATGSIVSVLNIVYKANITVPFFFGGDGATFIVPASVVDSAMHALLLYQENTRTNLKLELRVGTVAVKDIYENGHELRISKYKNSEILFIPILLGNGLSYAEKRIKAKDYLFSPASSQEVELDLTGMQCRWDKISPRDIGSEVVTLLVIAAGETRQSEAFRKVINLIEKIYGSAAERQPISIPRLRQKTSFRRVELELRAKLNDYWALGLMQTWFNVLIAYLYFKTEKGKSYLNRLVSMSDTLVIDGRINTVISGNSRQRHLLEAELNKLEQAGELAYGLHVSQESVMSCYVRNLDDGHIHFIDGSEGGYTKAAGILKGKLKK